MLSRVSHQELVSYCVVMDMSPSSSRASQPDEMHPLMAAGAGSSDRQNSKYPKRRALESREQTADVADDRSPHAERVDWTEDRRWTSDRRIMALAPGTAREPRSQPGAPADAAAVAAKLSSERAFRCGRKADCRARGAGTKGERRMGANPHANGGALLRNLKMPNFRDYAVDVPDPRRSDGRGDARHWSVPT